MTVFVNEESKLFYEKQHAILYYRTVWEFFFYRRELEIVYTILPPLK